MKINMSFLFLLLFIGANAQTSSDLTAAYYFSGNSNDEIGENHLVVHGEVSLTTDRFGNENCAYFFPSITLDDINNTVIGDSSAYLYLTNPNENLDVDNETGWSLSLWYQGGSAEMGDLEHIFMRNTNPTYEHECFQIALYDLNTPLTSVSVENEDINYIWAEQNDAILDSSSWHHAVLVVNSSNQISFYVDNNLQGTIENALISEQCESVLYVGYDFHGKIDDINFYHSALNESQIDSLFLAESSCAGFTGIIEQREDKLDFDLYPNPAGQEFTLTLSENWSRSVIKIYNSLGELMKQITPTSEKTKFLSADWPEGVYLVYVENDVDKVSTVKKLVVKK